MAIYNLLQSGKALAIAFLFLCNAPVMAAEENKSAAPPQVEQQVRDAVLDQWQVRAREAEIRAEQAEVRERDAQLEKLTDQAKQAQTRMEQAEQRSRDAEIRQSVLQAKSDLEDKAYARLESVISVFGILLTGIIIFFSLSTKETAVAAAKAGVEDIRGKLEARLVEAEALVAKLRDHESKADSFLRELRPAQEPGSEQDRKTVADVAKEATPKLPRDRTANEFRAIIINLLIQKNWSDMLKASQQMQLLYDGDDDFGFARFNEAYALGQLNRWDEAIAVYDALIGEYGGDKRREMRERIRKAHYNRACAYARKRSVRDTIIALQSMLRAGYTLIHKQITEDTAFDAIRGLPDFKKFLDENKGENKG
ncbi:MAG: TPR end-of-group domain-containing protein [Pseudomonadota bacterium]